MHTPPTSRQILSMPLDVVRVGLSATSTCTAPVPGLVTTFGDAAVVAGTVGCTAWTCGVGDGC